MDESYLAQFRELVRTGVSTQDIHDVASPVGYARRAATAPEAFVRREIERVALHQASLCPLLEETVGKVETILDVGCSTGGTTVALALSPILGAAEVVGVDPNHSALEAAEIRARAYGLPPERVRFHPIAPDRPLPFEDVRFPLTVCVSVLEFVSTLEGRRRLAGELKRVTRPGGYIFLATPSPFRLREHHSRRWLGHYLRRPGFPWSCTPGQLQDMFKDCQPISLRSHFLRQMARKVGGRRVPAWMAPVAARLAPWQKILVRKPKP